MGTQSLLYLSLLMILDSVLPHSYRNMVFITWSILTIIPDYECLRQRRVGSIDRPSSLPEVTPQQTMSGGGHNGTESITVYRKDSTKSGHLLPISGRHLWMVT